MALLVAPLLSALKLKLYVLARADAPQAATSPAAINAARNPVLGARPRLTEFASIMSRPPTYTFSANNEKRDPYHQPIRGRIRDLCRRGW